MKKIVIILFAIFACAPSAFAMIEFSPLKKVGDNGDNIDRAMKTVKNDLELSPDGTTIIATYDDSSYVDDPSRTVIWMVLNEDKFVLKERTTEQFLCGLMDVRTDKNIAKKLKQRINDFLETILSRKEIVLAVENGNREHIEKLLWKF